MGGADWRLPETKGSDALRHVHEIYELLDIPAVRQVPDNAKRIKEIATKCGWVYTRRRIGGSRDRKWAFFPDHVGQQADE